MRRSVLSLTRLIPLAVGGLSLIGCEDGPNQTFSAAPPGAENLWNNGGADASTNDPGAQNYDGGGGGTNAVNICTAAEQNEAWSKAFTADIVPPFSMGGMDLSTGGTFSPFTIEMAEHGVDSAGFKSPKLCQGEPAGAFDDSNLGYAWGPGGQIYTAYDIATHQLTFFQASVGYTGQVKFTLPAKINGITVPAAVDQNGKPGDLAFVWEIGKAIKENGVTLPLGWTSGGIDKKIANKLYLGLMATFQPTLISVTNKSTNPPLTQITDPGFDCLAAGTCRTSANSDKSGGNFGVRPVGVYFDAAQSNSTDPETAGQPSDIYMYPVKFVPYSLAPYNEGLDTFVSTISDPNLKFNGQPIYGPYSPAGVLSPPGGKAKPFCTIYMGSTWKNFLDACINVTSDPTQDNFSLAKLLGAQHHSAEWYTFSVVGVNQNFSADDAELTQNGLPGVLSDTQGTIANPPHDDDVATDFIVDVRASGAVLNDTRGDAFPAKTASTAGNTPASCDPALSVACANGDATACGDAKMCTNITIDQLEDGFIAGQDFHGAAAVMGYYRQLVFDDLRRLMPSVGVTPAADPKTCWMDSTTQSASTWLAPAGCTGMEMMITPAMPPATRTTWQDFLDMTPENTLLNGLRTIFRPGDPLIDFLSDPAHLSTVDDGGLLGVTVTGGVYDASFGGNMDEFTGGDNNLLQSSLLQVTAIMGHGNPRALPAAARDWRYYFKFWAQAFTKYLLNRSKNPTWHDLYNDDTTPIAGYRKVDQDSIFFDLFNGLDKFEYVDRSAAQQLGAPIDFEYDILLSTSNTQDNNFYQRLEREEKALYQTMLGGPKKGGYTSKTDVPGSNSNINISDLFGAPALAGHYCSTPSDDGTGKPVVANGVTKDAHYCCSTLINGAKDPDCPKGPPKDSSGNYLVDGDGDPLFTNYKGIFTGTEWTIGQTIPFQQTLPYIGSALVNLDNYADPYDTTSKSTPLTTIVPWIPSQPGEGFEIPINAQRSQYVQTGALDFSGVTITMNVDYIPAFDDKGNITSGTIAAVETQDFLGEVFPCRDGATGDILRVRMYTSMQELLDWFDSHPGTRAACNIYVRTSPYDNYPDYVVSLKNGVALSINPGAGGGSGRVADVTLFNPALLTQAQ